MQVFAGSVSPPTSHVHPAKSKGNTALRRRQRKDQKAEHGVTRLKESADESKSNITLWDFETVVEQSRLSSTFEQLALHEIFGRALCMEFQPLKGLCTPLAFEQLQSGHLLSWMLSLGEDRLRELLAHTYDLQRDEIVESMVHSIQAFHTRQQSQMPMIKNSKYSTWTGTFSSKVIQARFGKFSDVTIDPVWFHVFSTKACSTVQCLDGTQVHECLHKSSFVEFIQSVRSEPHCLQSTGKLDDFKKGLDSYLGMPSFNVEITMFREHCQSHESQAIFHPPNNEAMKTTPHMEWHYVVEFDPLQEYPGADEREGAPLHAFLSHKNAKKAGLTRPETIGLRLYTGPMFARYNSVLRGGQKEYVTTIHAIVSGIIKLAAIMVLPVGRKVYRGLSGLQLPPEFWNQDEYGARGGVEFGIMSTTTQKNIAVQFSTHGSTPTIFEIEIGQVDRGAELKWISVGIQ